MLPAAAWLRSPRARFVLAGCGGSSEAKGPPDLLFVSTRDGDYAIFGADAQGGHIRRLTKEKGDPSTATGLFFQIEPAWSPDGAQIAFASKRDGATHIFVMQADGTGTRRLTNAAKDDDHPSWSPDGKTDRLRAGGRAVRDPGRRRAGAPRRRRARERRRPRRGRRTAS